MDQGKRQGVEQEIREHFKVMEKDNKKEITPIEFYNIIHFKETNWSFEFIQISLHYVLFLCFFCSCSTWYSSIFCLVLLHWYSKFNYSKLLTENIGQTNAYFSLFFFIIFDILLWVFFLKTAVIASHFFPAHPRRNFIQIDFSLMNSC